MEDILTKVRAFIVDNFLFGRDDEALSNEDSLIESGVIDSTGVLMLVSFLEQSLGVHVEDDEIVPDNLDSIDRLARFAARKLALTEEAATESAYVDQTLVVTVGPSSKPA